MQEIQRALVFGSTDQGHACVDGILYGPVRVGIAMLDLQNRQATVARTDAMDWKRHIHSNPEILVGKPVIRGTRLAVDFVLGLFAVGWTEQQVLESYPSLTPEAIRAVFAFAADCVKEESLYTTAGDAASG